MNFQDAVKKAKKGPDILPPLPKGKLVNGFNVMGIFGFPGHKDHGIFRLISEPKKAKPSNSGYHQSVQCLICGNEWDGVDCEFLVVPVTKVFIQHKIRDITRARNHLLRVRKELSQELDK